MPQKSLQPTTSVHSDGFEVERDLEAFDSRYWERRTQAYIASDQSAALFRARQAMHSLTVVIARWASRLLNWLTLGNLPPFVGVAAVIERDHKILMLARSDGLGLSLPGGIVKWKETVEEALWREVLEETGYETEAVALINVYSGPWRDPRFSSVEIAYSCAVINGHGRSSPEGELVWVPEARLPDNLAFDHALVIAHYLEHRDRLQRAK